MKCGPTMAVLYAIACIQNLHRRYIMTDAILSGIVIYPGEYPSLVFLATVYSENRYSADNRVRGCGGTLIDSQWVLTAAHCFFDHAGNFIEPHKWVATFGNTRLGDTVQGLNIDITNFVHNNKNWLHVQRRISKIVLYPLYKKTDYHTHDIALLMLSQPVPLDYKTINISPIPLLPHEKVLPMNTICSVAGWGCQIPGGDLSVLALRGDFIIRANSACNGLVGNMTNQKICAGYGDGTFSICQGDSGGPLMCPLNGKHILVGIASYCSKADPYNHPNVFTRVESYTDWITTTIQSHFLF